MAFMIGSNRPRMLSLALPHVTWWNSWYSGFDNDPARVASLVDKVEAACVQVGTRSGDPQEVGRGLPRLRWPTQPPYRRHPLVRLRR